MPEVLNAKGKKFSWSYSALNDFEGCPRRYAASRFYCTVDFQETEAIRYGNRVHAAAEHTIKGVPHNDPEAYEPVKPYVERMLATPFIKEAEVEIALRKSNLTPGGLQPCKWFDKDAWLRIKIDVVLTDKATKTARLYDFKTGGRIKDNDDQIRLNFAGLSMVRPYLQNFEGKYIWTKHKEVTGVRPATKDTIPDIWAEFLPRVRRMEVAWQHERFPMRSSGLCGWCQVLDCKLKRG